MPPLRRQESKELLDGILSSEVIQPSSSPWASPVVLVPEKKWVIRSFRFCIDYRKVNAVTRKDAYPLPRVDDTLARSKLFSTLDLLSGYWQVEVSPEDREKTAFCTHEGLFEFRKMPFGLCNAPATFQRLMDAVLAGLQWSSCLVYIDDIVIPGRTFQAQSSWPTPTSQMEVQQFLGLASYYRRFVKDFAAIAKPLYQLHEVCMV